MLIEEKHSTQELTQVLCEARFIQHYFERYKDELITDPPYQYLERKIKEKGIKKKVIHKRSELDSYFYRVLSGERHPSRDKLLRITISMELDLEETQELLRIFNLAPLYPRHYRDAVIIYGISRKMNVIGMNLFLDENNLMPLE